jgi:hypothetical protein
LYGHMVGVDGPITWWHSEEGGKWKPVEKNWERTHS